MKSRLGMTSVLGMGLWTFVLLAGCGTTSVGVGPREKGSSTASNGPSQIVHVVAMDFQWKLDKTVFSAGQPIKFEVTSQEGIHGFSIDGTSVNKTVPQGQTVDISWTPPSGKYTIRCDVYCGTGHANMFTSFIVK